MNIKTKHIIALTLVIIGIVTRLLPHAWNFAPITAIGLFAGARLGKKYALLLPVTAMFISDYFIGFYDWHINFTVYIAMALSGFIGLLLRHKKSPFAIGVGSIVSSTLFFLLTNGAVLLFTNMYTKNITGLLASYVAGLPFFRNAIVGDIWYTIVFFGVYELVLIIYKQKQKSSGLLKTL